jgi:putative Mg2+ transporter-C (MgtC) family protein
MQELMAASVEQIRLLGTVLLAFLVGGTIGYERESANKPAGLRTHMLVCGAAALLVGLGRILMAEFHSEVGGGSIRTDPTRVIEAMITGVSFLGAGTIIRGRNHVAGLTTAASLLVTAAIGASIALGQFVLALGTTALALLTLRVVWKARKQTPPTEGSRPSPPAGR